MDAKITKAQKLMAVDLLIESLNSMLERATKQKLSATRLIQAINAELRHAEALRDKIELGEADD